MICLFFCACDGIMKLFVNRLVSSSFEELLAFQRALKEFVGSADPVYSKQYEEFFIGLEGRQVLLNCCYRRNCDSEYRLCCLTGTVIDITSMCTYL